MLTKEQIGKLRELEAWILKQEGRVHNIGCARSEEGNMSSPGPNDKCTCGLTNAIEGVQELINKLEHLSTEPAKSTRYAIWEYIGDYKAYINSEHQPDIRRSVALCFNTKEEALLVASELQIPVDNVGSGIEEIPYTIRVT